jgi:hypothetical protein
MEMISIEDLPWSDHHHRSYFLPCFYLIEDEIKSIFRFDIVSKPQSTILTRDTIFEGNLGNIT